MTVNIFRDRVLPGASLATRAGAEGYASLVAILGDLVVEAPLRSAPGVRR